jgi:hypothetical protein
MPDAAIIDFQTLLDKIEPLIQTMQYVKMDVSLSPQKEHIITSIKYQGLNQMRTDFIQRLTSSTIKYVLSKSQYEKRKTELIRDEGFDETDATIELFQQARNYFRTSEIKGQFAELLLYNLLQHYFKAIPVVRKMRITTNTEVERHGADAIHLGETEDKNPCVFLGEAKTYPSGFKAAFAAAIKSIINTYREHRKELHLHKYEDFIEPQVRSLMKDYLSGKTDLPVKLVIIISYCTGEVPGKTSKEEYHQYFVDEVLKECKKITLNDYRDDEKKQINEGLLKELHYIFFPIDELEKLLADFSLKLGLR